MGEHIYNLHVGDESTRSFRADLAYTTNKLLEYFNQQKAAQRVEDFKNYIGQNDLEPVRSSGEYMIEYVMIGLFWRDYSAYAANLSTSTRITCNLLYNARSRAGSLKPVIDKIRGRIHTAFLLRNDNHHELLPSRDNLIRLLKWLEASREFNEEVRRIEKWVLFLKDKSPIYIANFIGGCLETAKQFEKISAPPLSRYAGGIQKFLTKAPKQYHNREDIIFCTRPVTHYYFNWVAAEILNRELKEQFTQAARKIVLLPTCMSTPENESCQAKTTGKDIQCTGCSRSCRINVIRKQLRPHGIEVRLIPHSSGFSKWLEPYRDHTDVGLVGVACTLNLLKGGYEMKALNIPSQCVFLSFCGCKKHWPAINKPTDLDLTDLFSKLDLKPKTIPNWEIILNETKKAVQREKLQMVSSNS